MFYPSWPVVWWSEGLMNGIVWNQFLQKFMEGWFIVVGVVWVAGVLGLSLMVL